MRPKGSVSINNTVDVNDHELAPFTIWTEDKKINLAAAFSHYNLSGKKWKRFRMWKCKLCSKQPKSHYGKLFVLLDVYSILKLNQIRIPKTIGKKIFFFRWKLSIKCTTTVRIRQSLLLYFHVKYFNLIGQETFENT
jgi:hypothetical protein